MTGEGSLEAPTREIIKWQDPDFADPVKLDAEMRRVFTYRPFLPNCRQSTLAQTERSSG